MVVSLFFFGFVVALVLCVKPAPEQQRLDDAIGFLRDHAEVRIAEFQFPPPPSPFSKTYLSLILIYACCLRITITKQIYTLHLSLITLSVNRDYTL